MATRESILKKEKAVDIIQCLSRGPKHIRELRNQIGGSASTTVSRIRELEALGVVKHVKSDRFPFKSVVTLTDRGKKVADLLTHLTDPMLLSETITRNGPEPELGGAGWILALLYAMGGQIFGSTRLEKLLFILKNESPSVSKDFYDFQPHNYGPFSADILEDARNLARSGLVAIKEEILGPPGESDDDYKIRRTYFLTIHGKRSARRIFDQLPSHQRKALQGLNKLNRMPLPELLDYVYTRYKGYKQ